MVASTVASPQMSRIADLADQAKTTQDGIMIWFEVSKYGSLKACKSAARGMQVSFCNLRVRSRRIAQRLKGETVEALAGTTRGEYDDLACVVRPLPRDAGYTVSFIPGYAVDMDLKITDIATGEAFGQEDPTMNRFLVLMGKLFKEHAEATKQRRAPLNPFTTDELKFMWEYEPDECERMEVPALNANAVHDATDYANVDLADLPESELEIVNPSPLE